MPNIFDPINIGPMKVKNRIVAGPLMSNTDIDGHVTQNTLELYEERAAGGAGLIHVEACAVRKDGRPFDQIGLWHDRFLPGLARLADAIHRGGAKASVQLLHAGRQASPSLNKVSVWAPSSKTPPWAQNKPRALSTEECDKIIDAYAAAALRCKQAGFDCVLYHGTHGFLPQQFMSPWTNVDRNDKYAGPTAFVTELVKRTRSAVGPDMALIFRIPGTEHLGKYGLTPEMMAEVIAPALEEAGIDSLDVTAGLWLRFDVIIPGLYYPKACLVPYAEVIKKKVSVPVAGGGRINDFRSAQSLIETERVDMVYLGRQLLADPEFPNKALNGKYDEIRKCIACEGCFTPRLPHSGMICAVNPSLAREKKFPLTPVENPKKVLIAGGGVGGMEAARVAALRGHDVTLYEQTNRLGGLVNIAAAIRRVHTSELIHYSRQLSGWLKNMKNVNIQLGKSVTLDLVKELRPDAVLIATGSKPLIPEIVGVDKPIVMTKDDSITNHARVGKKVVILGGPRGAEIAVSFCRSGRDVTVLETGGIEAVAAAPYIKGMRAFTLRRMVFESGANILPEVKIEEITDHGVNYVDNEGNACTVEADSVILALGRVPNNALVEELSCFVKNELDGELVEIGDCVKPLDQLNAIHDGFCAAYGISDPKGRELAQLARVQREAGLQTVIHQDGLDMLTDSFLMLMLPYMEPGDDLKPEWEPTSPALEMILAPHPQAD